MEMVHTANQPTKPEGERAKKDVRLRFDAQVVFMLAASFLKPLKA